jgi:hypothetical protein
MPASALPHTTTSTWLPFLAQTPEGRATVCVEAFASERHHGLCTTEKMPSAALCLWQDLFLKRGYLQLHVDMNASA